MLTKKRMWDLRSVAAVGRLCELRASELVAGHATLAAGCRVWHVLLLLAVVYSIELSMSIGSAPPARMLKLSWTGHLEPMAGPTTDLC